MQGDDSLDDDEQLEVDYRMEKAPDRGRAQIKNKALLQNYITKAGLPKR